MTARAGRPQWEVMRPGDFDTAADVPLPMSTGDLLRVTPASDGCGTGDLLTDVTDGRGDRIMTRFVCKRCAAESPAGIGYADGSTGPMPGPAAGCPGPHAAPAELTTAGQTSGGTVAPADVGRALADTGTGHRVIGHVTVRRGGRDDGDYVIVLPGTRVYGREGSGTTPGHTWLDAVRAEGAAVAPRPRECLGTTGPGGLTLVYRWQLTDARPRVPA